MNGVFLMGQEENLSVEVRVCEWVGVSTRVCVCMYINASAHVQVHIVHLRIYKSDKSEYMSMI